MAYKPLFNNKHFIYYTEAVCPACGGSLAEDIQHKANDITTENETLLRLTKMEQSPLQLGKKERADLESYQKNELFRTSIVRCDKGHKYHVLINSQTLMFSFDDETQILIKKHPELPIKDTVTEPSTLQQVMPIIETSQPILAVSNKLPSIPQSEEDWLFVRRYPGFCNILYE